MKLTIINEMPLSAYHVKSNVVGALPPHMQSPPKRVEPGTKYIPPRFTPQSANALRQPKVEKQLTKVLSRTNYNIIIIADAEAPAVTSPAYNQGDPEIQLDDAYYRTAGIDPRLADDAITIIISFDNAIGQHHLSPWIILHQIGEIATTGGTDDPWYTIYNKYKEYLNKTPIARGNQEMVDIFGGEEWKDAFTHIFDMKSAREFTHGGFDNFDTGAELVAEFLWHGKIRVNYPDWIESEIIDTIKNELETEITRKLDLMIGKAYNNDVM